MLSLDVKSLFTNVDLPLVISFIHRKFSDDSFQLPAGLTIDALIELIKLCTRSTIFTFNDCFYQQTFGVPMGSPLSCILANIMMECIESELLALFPIKPALWVRYVDDIFCIWPYDMKHFDEFLNGINQLVPTVVMTPEWENFNFNTGEASLPFLDVLIHRSPSGITYSVFKKPSHVHSYIHYFSSHAPHVKRGVLSGLFTRALRISSPIHLQSELNNLWAAFKRLGYPHFFICEALSSAKTKFYAPPASSMI